MYNIIKEIWENAKKKHTRGRTIILIPLFIIAILIISIMHKLCKFFDDGCDTILEVMEHYVWKWD